MSKEKILLVIASILILLGLFKPDFTSLIPVSVPSVVDVINVDPPTDENLKALADKVVECFKSGSSDRKTEALKLAELYYDISILVSLDAEEEAISSTEAIRQANMLAGPMLRMKIKGKYDGLAEAADNLVTSNIGTENVKLTEELRDKSVEAFLALSWACLEGSK